MSNRKPNYKELATQPRRRLPHEAFLGSSNDDKDHSEQTIHPVENKVLSTDIEQASNHISNDVISEDEKSSDDVNDANNEASNKVSNEASNGVDDILNKNKNSDKRYRGFYLSPELDEALDVIKEKYGKGALSELVNVVLTEGLSKRGIIRKNNPY